MRHTLACVAILAFLSGATRADAATFDIDPVHSSAQFAVRHLMVSKVRGTLGKVTGTLTLDEADPTKSTVEASVDATSIDTREPKRDAHLKSPDFLDVANYPTITFKSKQATKTGDGKYSVTGDLTMRGVTKQVVLEVEGWPKPIQDPSGNVKLGGAVRTKLKRQDFGINWSKTLDGGGLVVGDDVDVVIDVELVQRR